MKVGPRSIAQSAAGSGSPRGAGVLLQGRRASPGREFRAPPLPPSLVSQRTSSATARPAWAARVGDDAVATPTSDLRTPRTRSPGSAGDYWSPRAAGTGSRERHWEKAAASRSKLLLASVPGLNRTHSSPPRAASPPRDRSWVTRTASAAAPGGSPSVSTRVVPELLRERASMLAISRDGARYAAELAGLQVEPQSFDRVFESNL